MAGRAWRAAGESDVAEPAPEGFARLTCRESTRSSRGRLQEIGCLPKPDDVPPRLIGEDEFAERTPEM